MTPKREPTLTKRGDKVAVPGKRKGQMTEYEHLGKVKKGKTETSGLIVRKT